MPNSEYRIGTWWVPDKRGEQASHLIESLTEAPEAEGACAVLGYDYRMWSSACGSVVRSSYMHSTPESHQNPEYGRCLMCSDVAVSSVL